MRRLFVLEVCGTYVSVGGLGTIVGRGVVYVSVKGSEGLGCLGIVVRGLGTQIVGIYRGCVPRLQICG